MNLSYFLIPHRIKVRYFAIWWVQKLKDTLKCVQVNGFFVSQLSIELKYALKKRGFGGELLVKTFHIKNTRRNIFMIDFNGMSTSLEWFHAYR